MWPLGRQGAAFPFSIVLGVDLYIAACFISPSGGLLPHFCIETQQTSPLEQALSK